jgi:hypothetical protein
MRQGRFLIIVSVGKYFAYLKAFNYSEFIFFVDHYVDRKSNEEVLKEINEKRTILRVVGMRKVKLIGRLLRHNDFVTNIMEGRVLGKEGRGRPRLSYIKTLMKELFCNSYVEMKRLAQDRHLWLQRQGLAFRE